ncbi:AAA-ATPase Vps4-associated protein 1-domain-containing protein [Mrakia frigida]|uniref:AAA-ATPase Vps4-associated protein 1-domain-containing protein n=1 Tax=Mrakia frigida TaxID=29902 RepID=UPI003FCC083A
MPPKPEAPKVTNRYYQRTAGTARPCFICFRESTTVLSTFNTTDFLYVCPGHLLDRGFATLLTPPSAPPSPASSGPSKEEIAKVIADYERKKSKGKDKDEDKKDKKEEPASAPFLTPSVPAAPPPPSHPVYELHRDYWALRQSEMKKRDNLVKAKAVSKDLPRVPASAFGAIVRPRPGPDGGGIV